MWFSKTNDPFDCRISLTLKGIDKGHHNTTYKGVKCIKSPFDYVIYQMIISEVRPDLVIEIGSYEGGSALYIADLLELYGSGEIHTIDIQDNMNEQAKSHKRIKFFSNGWENYDLGLTEKYKSILVIEDSSHKYSDTLNVMIKFSKVVSIGSYLIVEDGIIDELGLSNEYEGGPVRAIKKFLSDNKGFEISYHWTNFFGKNVTFNTLGYLRKVF